MTSPTFEVSGSVVAFATDGTATSFSVVPEALTFEVVNVAGYTVAVTALDELSDVNTSGVSNGDALVYDSGTWVPGTGSGGGTASVVLTGDVLGTAVAGTVTADIADSGVAAGTYGSSGTAVVVTVAADGRITSISGTAIAGSGGDSLPTQAGNAGAVLGTNATATSWARSFTSPDGETVISAFDGGGGVDWNGPDGEWAWADVDSVEGAFISASDGVSESATVKAKPDGTIVMESTGAATVTPGDGFHVVGSVGETVLSGDDYLMSTASDTDVTAPGATFARARGSMVSKSAVTNGDILAYPLYAQGHDGTSLVLAGQITAEVDGTVATGKVPTRIRIATADADGVLTDRMTIGADGTTDVLGDFTVNGSPVSGGGGGGLVLVYSADFSAVSPAFDGIFTDPGVYRIVLTDLVVATGGSNYLRARFRTGGTDNSGTHYAASEGTVYTGTTSADDNVFLGYAAGNPAFVIMEASRVAEAAPTLVASRYVGRAARETTSVTTPSAAFDGIKFYNDSAATLAGHIDVYHYEQAP